MFPPMSPLAERVRVEEENRRFYNNMAQSYQPQRKARNMLNMARMSITVSQLYRRFFAVRKTARVNSEC
jgi:hypothetical protein